MIDMTASVTLTAVKAAEKFNDYCKNDPPSLNKFLFAKLNYKKFQFFYKTRRRCRILCLDEATAHLDSETESLLQEAIRRHSARVTIINISHRRGADLNADKTLVMSFGRVEAFR